jgi:predicted nucleic acid-binding protein
MSLVFLDTGLVLKLLVEESLSPVVRRFLEKRRVAVPFPKLIEVEVENTLQAMLFRADISSVQLLKCRDLVYSLIAEGRFLKIPLSLDVIAAEALTLSPVVTAQTGCRTLDLMHVATAKLLGAAKFVSTDKRQLRAAEVCGLKILDLSVWKE